MAERISLCPKCNSRRVTTLKIHNPETTEMNAKATLKCLECSREWEGKVTSPEMRKLQQKGLRR